MEEIVKATLDRMELLKSSRRVDDSDSIECAMYDALDHLDGKYKYIDYIGKSKREKNEIKDINKGYNGIMKLFNKLVEKYKGRFTAEEIADIMSSVDF